jgi:murein DD-endopeptidase MepM/ murein hydrolase activator NlpD
VPLAAPAPADRFALLPDGPHGCPLATDGRIVITQGYGVGTHAPAEIWGAVDLALADRETLGTPVVATHDGVARVFPMSWPGGNFVMIIDEASGFTTAYGHLDTITVAEGQQVAAGTQIGTAGATGMASGPHLHYEVRTPHGNIDPAPLIGCG